ncbi:MAG TPA: efflux transporter outer membrane subunit [Burkholderiales bacterium]|nr:efflux transporter outer membrane subunit [Burkholderiales bacterium]
MRPGLWLWTAAIGACLAGCAVGPNYHTPEMKVPEGFVAAPGAGKPSAAGADKQALDLATWWHVLNDTELDSLVDRAIQANLSLEIALTRLQEARTFEVAITGLALPEVEASVGAARGTGSNLARGRASPPLVSASNTAGLKQITGIAGVDGVWTLDIFGKYRRAIEAARYDTQAAGAARNAVLITIVANVVRAYVDMRGLQMQLAVLQKDIGTAQTSLELVQARFDRGIINELDVTLAKRELATLQAQVAPLAAQIQAAQYALAVLIGRFPEDIAKELEKPGLVPNVPEKIDAGLPLDVIRRRPDIREAEWRLAGATARIGVATADLFPQVAITAGAGVQGQGLGVTPVVQQSIWSVGVVLTWPLLDFGTLDALVDVADLRARELLLNYKQTVLSAVQEVDTAFSGYTAQEDRLRNLGDALAASQQAVSLASQRYDRGLTDYLNVVDAQRQEYDLAGQYASAQMTAAEQLVALYKSLGGGWEQYQSIPPIRQPQPAIVAAFRRVLAPEDPLK